MRDCAREFDGDVLKSTIVRQTPTLDRDLRVRRFQREDTRRIHNLFLEETRCLLWPMFVQTVRSPSAVILHVMLIAVGVLLARSCILALFSTIVALSGIFLYIYRWFYQYLTSSLKGDLANISQVSHRRSLLLMVIQLIVTGVLIWRRAQKTSKTHGNRT